MSKEIAQTISGGKFAWFLAIVAAFAVLATLGSAWQKPKAMSVPEQAPLVLSVHVDAAIPGGRSIVSDSISAIAQKADNISADKISASSARVDGVGGMAPFAHLVLILAESRAAEGSNTFSSAKASPVNPSGVVGEESSHLNGQTIETASLIDTSGKLGVFSSSAGSSEVIASSADNHPEAIVPMGVAQESTGNSQADVPGSSKVDAKSGAKGGDYSANWLFAVLGLGAIVFGISGIAVARRSR